MLKFGTKKVTGRPRKTPRPPDLTEDELLVLLIEECGEVIQAATKCLRFGFDREKPGYGVNSEVLAAEVGDVMGIVDALPLNQDIVLLKRAGKISKVRRVKAEIAAADKRG